MNEDHISPDQTEDVLDDLTEHYLSAYLAETATKSYDETLSEATHQSLAQYMEQEPCFSDSTTTFSSDSDSTTPFSDSDSDSTTPFADSDSDSPFSSDFSSDTTPLDVTNPLPTTQAPSEEDTTTPQKDNNNIIPTAHQLDTRANLLNKRDGTQKGKTYFQNVDALDLEGENTSPNDGFSSWEQLPSSASSSITGKVHITKRTHQGHKEDKNGQFSTQQRINTLVGQKYTLSPLVTRERSDTMDFAPVKGNTWVLCGLELLPVYILPQAIDKNGFRSCILFDTGYPSERSKLEASLLAERLIPKAVFCTHAHVDHIGSGAYLQEKYQIPLFMSQAEGGMLSNIRNMKAYRITVSHQEAEDTMGDCISKNITLLEENCKSVEVEGVSIAVYQTPGHSSQHLCFGTPDGVCYLGDALLSHSQMDAKLPYALDIALTLQSHRKILDFPETHYIMAHDGICAKEDLLSLVQANQEMYLDRAKAICDCAGFGKTIDLLTMDYCKLCNLNTRRAKRITHYQRNIRLFLEFLEDIGDVRMEMSEMGILWKSTSDEVVEDHLEIP